MMDTLGRRMSEADSIFFKWEHDPALRVPIVSVMLFEGRLDRDRVLAKFESSLRVIPRFYQRVARAPWTPGPPLWVNDPDFSLDRHVHFMTAPGDGSMRAILDWAAPLAMTRFDPERPLWEAFVVEGVEGSGTAIVRRQHHGLSDGVGLVELAVAFGDFEAEPAPETLAPLPPAPAIDAAAVRRMAWRDEATKAADLAVRTGRRASAMVRDPAARRLAREKLHALRLVANDRVPEPGSPIMRGRSDGARLDQVSFPLAELRLGAKSAGGTVNDGYVAAIAGGLRRYHDVHGAKLDTLRCSIPVNMRTEQDKGRAGNVMGGMTIDLPATIDDPAERVRTIGALVRAKRNDGTQEAQSVFVSVLNRLPARMVVGMMRGALVTMDVVCSNVAGPPIDYYFAGAPMRTMVWYGPRTGAAINTTMVSLQDTIYLAVNSDPAAVPDPEVVVDCMRQGLEEIAKLA